MAFVRSLPLAHTKANPPGDTESPGRTHLRSRVGSSVNDHPANDTDRAPELKISIQSDSSPSSSRMPRLLFARNSLMRTPSVPGTTVYAQFVAATGLAAAPRSTIPPSPLRPTCTGPGAKAGKVNTYCPWATCVTAAATAPFTVKSPASTPFTGLLNVTSTLVSSDTDDPGSGTIPETDGGASSTSATKRASHTRSLLANDALKIWTARMFAPGCNTVAGAPTT